MKLTLITLGAISALSIGSSLLAQQPQNDRQNSRDGRGGGGNHHSLLERTTEQLNLTPEQKTKVQPIIDQATPQIDNIRREAMQKMKTVMDNAMAQIRPLLTPEQQKKLDESQNDRRGGRGGRGGRHGQRDQNDQNDRSDQGNQ
jgi:Spy/CpxP family protein refolding chaperone